MGPIVRGLVRQSLSKSNGTNEELIAMIRLGSILSG